MRRRYGARIAATLIDLACMLPWIGVVAAAGAVLLSSGITRSVDPVSGNVIAFIVVIVPITITAAGFDAAPRHGTPGKRLLGLRVTATSSDGPAFLQALVRNAIKYALGWELAYTAIFALVGERIQTPAWVVVVLVVAYAIPVVSLALLLGTGRPPHDRIAHTSVVAIPSRRDDDEATNGGGHNAKAGGPPGI